MSKEAQQHEQYGVVRTIEEIGDLVGEGVADDDAAGGVVVEARHRIGYHRSDRLERDATLLPPRHRPGILPADFVEAPEVRVGMGRRRCLALPDEHSDGWPGPRPVPKWNQV